MQNSREVRVCFKGDVDEAIHWFNECLRQQAECMKKRVRERRIGMINNVIVSDNM